MAHCIKNTPLQAPSSQLTKQSLQASIPLPTLRKNKKYFQSKKSKTLPTHNPTDINVMTEPNGNHKGMSLKMKEGQLVTQYIKNGQIVLNFKCLDRI